MTLFTARVGWPGITFGKTNSDVLMKKKGKKRQIDRERLMIELENMYNMLLLFQTRFHFKFLFPKDQKKSWKSFVRNIKGGFVFYNNDLT